MALGEARQIRKLGKYYYVKVKVAQLCLTLCDSMDPTLCDSMDYAVRGILQARIL